MEERRCRVDAIMEKAFGGPAASASAREDASP